MVLLVGPALPDAGDVEQDLVPTTMFVLGAAALELFAPPLPAMPSADLGATTFTLDRPLRHPAEEQALRSALASATVDGSQRAKLEQDLWRGKWVGNVLGHAPGDPAAPVYTSLRYALQRHLWLR